MVRWSNNSSRNDAVIGSDAGPNRNKPGFLTPWLPAHTAPKDGSPILVWINRAGLGVGVSAVRWDVDEKTWKRLGSNVTLPIGAFDEWIWLGDPH
jgi:hypothetical protein